MRDKKQASLPLYIRFGDIPPDKKSRVHRGDALVREEGGLSVYRAIKTDVGLYFPLLPDDPNEHTLADYFDFLLRSDCKVFLVTGTELFIEGADREPLLMDDVIVVKELTHYYRANNKKARAEMRSEIIEELDREGFINSDKVREYAMSDRFYEAPSLKELMENGTKILDVTKYENLFKPTEVLSYYDINWERIQDLLTKRRRQTIALIGNHMVCEEMMLLMASLINDKFKYHKALYTKFDYDIITNVFNKAGADSELYKTWSNGIAQEDIELVYSCLYSYMEEADKRLIDIADVVIVFNVANRANESYDYMIDKSYNYAKSHDKEIIMFTKNKAEEEE